MRPICPRCHYSIMVDARASAVASPGAITCPRCGEPLGQLHWSGAQSSTLTTAAAAVAPQSLMENQNAHAPSADTVFEDVLDIPSPLRSSAPTGDQMLVLEDVIPAEEFSLPEESFEPQPESEEEETLLRTEPGTYILPGEPGRLGAEKSPIQVGPQVYGAAETSSFDYDNGRAWLRLAPVLLLIGVLVFFALYFLGNRMSEWGNKPQETAAAPAQPETPSAAQATAAPDKVEPNAPPAAASSQAPEASSPAAAQAREESPATTAAADAAPVTAPVAKPSAEMAKAESKPAESAPVQAPAQVAAVATQGPAPSAQSSTGNFTVQVGSYNNSAQADERAGRLRSSGVEARVVRAEIPRRGTWYRVQTGRFASREEAARFASELKGRGAADSFLVTEFQGQ
jgi:cell division protein FtsN